MAGHLPMDRPSSATLGNVKMQKHWATGDVIRRLGVPAGPENNHFDDKVYPRETHALWQ
jgi:hypothetical protein